MTPAFAHAVEAFIVEDDREDHRPALSQFPMRGTGTRYRCKRCGIVWDDTGSGTFGLGVVQIGAGDRELCRVKPKEET